MMTTPTTSIAGLNGADMTLLLARGRVARSAEFYRLLCALGARMPFIRAADRPHRPRAAAPLAAR